jgi:hypothetical protein
MKKPSRLSTATGKFKRAVNKLRTKVAAPREAPTTDGDSYQPTSSSLAAETTTQTTTVQAPKPGQPSSPPGGELAEDANHGSSKSREYYDTDSQEPFYHKGETLGQAYARRMSQRKLNLEATHVRMNREREEALREDSHKVKNTGVKTMYGSGYWAGTEA